MKTFSLIFILTIGVNLLLISGTGTLYPDVEFTHHAELKDGDLVLRNGRGWVSSWFRMSSEREKKYSHAGLVRKTTEGFYVIHMSQDHHGISKEPIHDFTDRSVCSSYALYRFELDDSMRSCLIRIMEKDLQAELNFDAEFSLDTVPPFYCTEWISTRLQNVTAVDFHVSGSQDFSYRAPDDLYLNDAVQLLYEKVYE